MDNLNRPLHRRQFDLVNSLKLHSPGQGGNLPPRQKPQMA